MLEVGSDRFQHPTSNLQHPMSAQLKPLGILKSYVGGQTQVSVEANQTVREIMRALNIPSDLVALVMVNDQPQSKEYRAQDGDVITLIAVVGGG